MGNIELGRFAHVQYVKLHERLREPTEHSGQGQS